MPLRPQPKKAESLSVETFYEMGRTPLDLKLVAGEKGLKRLIRDKAVNRPALAVTGYFKSFAYRRIQLLGAGEIAYLRDQSEEHVEGVLRRILAKQIPCLLVSRNLVPSPLLLDLAAEAQVPLFRSPLTTRELTNRATLILEDAFAPRISLHGTLLDVKGVGVLIRGRSGVGKSESALALIERGHSLVADDLVFIRLDNEGVLRGQSSELNRGYMECRGIGIVNIGELFGVRAVRLEKTIDLVVTFEEWKPGMIEERTGLETEFFDILEMKVPHIILPVRPGRDLARLVEVAALVQALKTMGHDSAKEFNERLIKHMEQAR
ncbi:MAG: HPr(Ser) kinase/phosphatase [Opitutales bacterium]